MGERKQRSWIPLLIMAALLLSVAVAWAYRDRLSRVEQCQALYAAAPTEADSAAVDTTVVPGVWTAPALPCRELVGPAR